MSDNRRFDFAFNSADAGVFTQGGGGIAPFGWALAAWLVLLVVFALNGGPLFYYDTAGYFSSGDNMLHTLGLFMPHPVAEGAAAGAQAGAPPDGAVTGNRAIVYALFATVFIKLGASWALVMAQAAILVLALHLVCRLVATATGRPDRAWPATAATALAGALGSAGFYTAYIMPDLFAATLLLSIAGLAAFAPDLRWGSALALLAVGIFSVVVHPSHLAIALMAAPGTFLTCLAFGVRRWWISGLLVTAIAAGGLLERMAFAVAVEAVAREEVVYLPFFTARLISDGPGRDYLDDTCADIGPDPEPSGGAVAGQDTNLDATCALNVRLVRPAQFMPDRILFSHDPEWGSFAMMSPEDRREISHEQRAFLRAVVLSRPHLVAAAALRNTFTQLGLVGIDMTLPTAEIAAAANRIYPETSDFLSPGRLTTEDWVETLTGLHQIYYALSALALVALLILPHSRLPRRVRLFGVLVLLGILANAFVTGAISQPANRYGARVIFLIPSVLVLLAMVRPAGGRRSAGTPT